MHSKRGFTLLEMSIVMLIIAGIAGAIMAGQSLVRTAKLQGVLREYNTYVKATKEFVDKYQGLPGDITNATTIWGAAGTCPNNTNVQLVSVATITTCNGDGNGKISPETEANAYWQQLANAGLIDGKYTGAYYNSGTGVIGPGVNTPLSKLAPGTWLMYYYSNPTTTGIMWGDHYGNALMMGNYKNRTAGYFLSLQPIMTPEETYSLDRKIDDGKPGTGIMRSLRTTGTNVPNCTENDSSQSAATYDDDYERVACMPLFITGF